MHRIGWAFAKAVMLFALACAIVGWPDLLPDAWWATILQDAWWAACAFWALVVLLGCLAMISGRRHHRRRRPEHTHPLHPRNERLYYSGRR